MIHSPQRTCQAHTEYNWILLFRSGTFQPCRPCNYHCLLRICTGLLRTLCMFLCRRHHCSLRCKRTRSRGRCTRPSEPPSPGYWAARTPAGCHQGKGICGEEGDHRLELHSSQTQAQYKRMRARARDRECVRVCKWSVCVSNFISYRSEKY